MNKAKVYFRVDASLKMGSGHLMRCLTLAEALRGEGSQCHFISREHPGHLLALIRQRGFELTILPAGPTGFQPSLNVDTLLPSHASWLNCDWEQDAEQTRAAIGGNKPDWLVVDHYALDAQWEKSQKDSCQRLMVIDDMTDRPHNCDLLLNQNLDSSEDAYKPLVPACCILLLGSKYALLRPEFAALRISSLKRREKPKVKSLLITMGGIDQQNATGDVLKALKNCLLPKNVQITVVMGSTAPWLESVTQQIKTIPWLTTVQTDVSDMAQLMTDADLSIGAAGSTSWERCCLGLPTIMAVLAFNQRGIADALASAGASIDVGEPTADFFQERVIRAVTILVEDPVLLSTMSLNASNVSDGSGTQLVLGELMKGILRCR